jgi:transposase-like protein
VGRIVEGKWVIGMIERGTGEMRVIVCPNNLRNAATLEPLILQNVIPGTTVITDEWPGYRNLNALGYVHQTVNHSRNFVNPATGAHTQKIESNWRPLKQRLCRGGVKRKDLGMHLAKYLWRREMKRLDLCPFNAVIRIIAHEFPPR